MNNEAVARRTAPAPTPPARKAVQSAKQQSQSRFAHELNAVVTVAARDILIAVKSPGMLIFSLLMPLVMMGMLGGSLGQNMAGGLGFEYSPFMMVGMVVTVLVMTTTMGITSLIQDRSEDFTQEMMIAPISRYSIVLGKIVGASVTALFQLIMVIIMSLVMGIGFTGSQLLALLAVAPLICLSAGAVGMLIVGFVKNPRMANIITMIVVMPQMFLSGAIIPIANSTGILFILSRIMPMTYCIDLTRALFYAGTPEYSQVVLFNPAINGIAIVALTIAFLVTGTWFFARSETNK